MWKFRVPFDDDQDGPPIHGNTTLEIIWTIIPTIIVVAFAFAAGIVLIRNEERPKDRLIVGVTAQQFAWTFDYGDGKKSTILVLPVDRAVQFDITSKIHDVIHSFYVPEFRVKADAVPGIMNHTYATPTRTGRYLLECTELCGIGHSQMRAPVRVMTQEKFATWLAALPVTKGAS
jgi:cytochrome c oxidase subunit 2